MFGLMVRHSGDPMGDYFFVSDWHDEDYSIKCHGTGDPNGGRKLKVVGKVKWNRFDNIQRARAEIKRIKASH